MWFRRRQYFGLTDAQMNERNAQGDDCRIRQDASVGNNATSWEDVPESNRSKYFCIMALGYYDSGDNFIWETLMREDTGPAHV